MAELAQICQLRPNVERLDVLGVACRRLAWLQTSKRERREALINMAGYLDKALDPAKGDNPHLYPSWAIAKLLATRIEEADDGPLIAAIEDGCRHMAEVAAARNRDDPRLRNALDEADNLLVAFVAAGGEDADAAQRVTDCYRAALARGASPREVAKVQEGIDFLIAFADQLKVPVVSALRDIRASL